MKIKLYEEVVGGTRIHRTHEFKRGNTKVNWKFTVEDTGLVLHGVLFEDDEGEVVHKERFTPPVIIKAGDNLGVDLERIFEGPLFNKVYARSGMSGSYKRIDVADMDQDFA